MSNVQQPPPPRSWELWRGDNRESMEKVQATITGQMLARMPLRSGERVLELNCGTGEATRLAAQAVAGGAGMAAGLDASPDNIAQARAASHELHNILFAVGDAEEIPWRDEYFDHVFSQQDFGAFRHPRGVAEEIDRVLVAGGQLHILARLGETNAANDVEQAAKPHHRLRCEEDYKRLLEASGFEQFRSTHLSEAHLPEGHCEGTLMLHARKAESARGSDEAEV
jgi:arsenite methyltransferase